MAKQFNTTHKMLIATSTSCANLIQQFLEEYQYTYEYSSINLDFEDKPIVGRETQFPDNVLRAVLKNNGVEDGKKVIFLIPKSDIDGELFKSEWLLFEKEFAVKITHTTHNVSIGLNKGKKVHQGRSRTTTSKSVERKWKVTS